MKYFLYAGIAAVITAISGCSSMVIKDDDIVKKTAFSLGWEKNSFTISDRTDDGVQTTYVATTKAGKKYNCSIDGSFSFGTGSIISDPICNEVGKLTNTKCNALSKAAGKC